MMDRPPDATDNLTVIVTAAHEPSKAFITWHSNRGWLPFTQVCAKCAVNGMDTFEVKVVDAQSLSFEQCVVCGVVLT